MAGNSVALTFSLGATLSSSYKAAFGSAQSAIRSVTSSIREMEKTPVGQLGAKMEAQRAKIKSLGAELQTTRSQLAALKGRADAAGGATGLLAKQIELAERDVARLGGQLKKTSAAYAENAARAANMAGSVQGLKTRYDALTASMERQRKVQAALVANQSKAQAISAKRSEAQGQLVGAMAMGAAAAAPIKLAVDFEQSMAKVGAVSRASAEDLKSLTDTARQLGRDTQFSASQAAEGMQYLAMAGFDASQTIAAMPGMLNLAAASGADLGRTADVASNILSGFKMSADQMDVAADALAATFTSSNTDLESLGESMKYVGPIASSVGMSMQDCAAAVGLLGNVGIQGSQAGTALRSALLRLSAPAKMTKDALAEMSGVTGEALDQLYEEMQDFAGGEEAMREVGVSVTDAAGNMRPMADILEELAVKTANLGSAEKAAAFKKIFGTEASSAMIALADAAVKTVDDKGNAIVDKAGHQTTALRQYMEQINDSEGEAARISEQMNDTTAGALKRLASAWEDVGISVGNMFLPIIRTAAGVLSTVANAIAGFTQRFPTLSSALALAAGAVVAFRVATAAAGIASAVFGGGLNSMAGMVLRVASSQAVSTAATGAWTAATTLAHGATTILSGAMTVLGGAIKLALGPVGLIITAIATAAYAIHENWDSMPGWFHDLWDTITGAFSRAWDFISGIVDKIASAVNFVIDGAKKIGSFFGFGGDVEKPEAPAGGGGGGSAKSASSKPSASAASAPAAKAASAPASSPAVPAVQPYDLSAQKFDTVPAPEASSGGGGGGSGKKKSSGGGGRKKSSSGGGGGGGGASASAAESAGTGTTIVSLGGDNSNPVTMYIPAGQKVPSTVSGGGSSPSLSSSRTSPAPASSGAGGLPFGGPARGLGGALSSVLKRALPGSSGLPSQSAARALGKGVSAAARETMAPPSAAGNLPGRKGAPAGAPKKEGQEGPESVTVNLTQDFGIMTSDPSTFRRLMEQLKPDFERLVRQNLAKISSDRTRTAHAQ